MMHRSISVLAFDSIPSYHNNKAVSSRACRRHLLYALLLVSPVVFFPRIPIGIGRLEIFVPSRVDLVLHLFWDYDRLR